MFTLINNDDSLLYLTIPDDEIGFDIETNSLDWFTCKLYTIQIATVKNIFVIDVQKINSDILKIFLNSLKDKVLIGHNIKFDLKVIYAKTGILFNHVYDTMIAETLINQGVGDRFYSLEDIVHNYCLVVLNKDVRQSFYNNDNDTLTYDQILYSAMDVKFLKEIKSKQLEKLENQKQLKVVDLEMSLIPVVAKMEYDGVLLDVPEWKKLMNMAAERAKEREKSIKDLLLSSEVVGKFENLYELCRTLKIPVSNSSIPNLKLISDPSFYRKYIEDNFNISSSNQVKAMLNLLGIPVESTNEKILTDFSDHEVVKLILEYRENFKLSTSFGDSFIEKIHPKTGRIHAEFNQLVDSGRFSSSNPNLQQIVRVNAYRKCFIARPGYKIITADYSQQELRLAGSISGEPKFIDAFKNGIDLHSLTASVIFQVPLEEVTKDQRQIAKGYNFAVLYGSSSAGLAYNFKLDRSRAEELLNRYYQSYPVLHYFKTQMENEIYKRGYSSTPLGRKRFFKKPELYSDYKEMSKVESKIKRQGFNHIIQGAGADTTKLAMVYIFNRNPFGDDLRILMIVHDEIVCEAKEEIVDKAVEFITNCMLDAERKFLKDIEPEVEIKYDDFWKK